MARRVVLSINEMREGERRRGEMLQTCSAAVRDGGRRTSRVWQCRQFGTDDEILSKDSAKSKTRPEGDQTDEGFKTVVAMLVGAAVHRATGGGGMAPSYVAVGSRDYARRGSGRRPRIEVRGGAAVAVGSRKKNGNQRITSLLGSI
ncbi:Os10g0131900 [Oryza sativa Japonica Group]|uniref:Os10g0131900 protein n=1 Tax=Oryza sativa subsp. japonica TaxID=39947 RepID=A0A0P0XRE9_ORYSJ|nr:Os10g0131900 [Oryza sativa Japonica Group]